MLTFCLVLIGYVAGSFVAMQLIETTGAGAVFFAPAGISAAAVLLSPTRRWPFIALAVVVGEVFADTQFGEYEPVAIAGFALANALEPLVGGLIVVRWRGRIALNRRDDLTAFVVGAVAAGPAIGGAIGAVTVALDGGSFWNVFISWWIGDALGVALVGSFVLGVFAASDLWSTSRVDTFARLGLAASVAIGVHWLTELPIGFVTIIPIVAISARSGTWMATIAANLVALIAIVAMLVGQGGIAGLAPADGMLVVQIQLLCITVTALLVAAESTEREDLSRQSGYQIETVRQLRHALAPPSVIRTAHVEAEGISQAASERLEVGGDWYDIFEGDSGEVSIIIGDVVGHSEAAVVGMGKMRSAAAALAQRTSDTGLVLDWMDEFARSMEDRPYATAFFGRFDPTAKTLTYSTAGHPPALLGKQDGSWEWLFGGRSTPIGVPFPQARPAATVELDGPCILIVYTDGAVERAGEVIDTGLARVYDAVSRRPSASVDELLDVVTQETVRDDASFVRVRLRC